jgi:hypothetical protein
LNWLRAIWAEAAYYETKGESLELPSSLYPAAAEQQEMRRMHCPVAYILVGLRGLKALLMA